MGIEPDPRSELHRLLTKAIRGEWGGAERQRKENTWGQVLGGGTRNSVHDETWPVTYQIRAS